MIEALINGQRPTARIENVSNDPPKSIKKLANPECAKLVCAISKSIFTNGTGITTNNL